MKQGKVCLALLVGLVALMTAGPALAKTEISFWHGYSEAETKVLVETLIPRFESAHPDIAVEATRLGYDELREKIVATAATGTGPDLVRIDIIWTPQFAAIGLLEPLDQYEGFDTYLEAIYPGPLSTNLYEGKYFGLPLTTNTQVYVYNRNIFDQAGVTAPRTIDEFHEVTRALTAMDGDTTSRWGYDIGGPWSWNLLPWIWNHGGDVTDPGISTAKGYLDGAETVEIIEKIASWGMEGILAPNIVGGAFDDSWGKFANGQVAARQDGPWFANWLKGTYPDFEAGYALMPHEPGLPSHSVVGGENIAITRGSKNKEAAWAFLRFMLSEQTQATMAEVGQIPVIKSGAALEIFRESEYYPVYLEQLLHARARTPHPRYPEIEQTVQAAFWKAVTGETSAKAALEEAAALIDANILK